MKRQTLIGSLAVAALTVGAIALGKYSDSQTLGHTHPLSIVSAAEADEKTAPMEYVGSFKLKGSSYKVEMWHNTKSGENCYFTYSTPPRSTCVAQK